MLYTLTAHVMARRYHSVSMTLTKIVASIYKLDVALLINIGVVLIIYYWG